MYIDTHVHFRDFKESYKETIRHGLEVARDSGVDAVFDMGNTDPPVIARESVIARFRLAREANVPEVFYRINMVLTEDTEQVKRAADVYREFPGRVNMKMYAGHSVRNMGVTSFDAQRNNYIILNREGYDGILVIHCEKESLLLPNLWTPEDPVTHCYARPEISEIESVKDQIALAKQAGFKGKLHVAHVSSPAAVDVIDAERKAGLDISCGVCPHHFIYNWTQMKKPDGVLWKMNPPLRSPESQQRLFQYLKEGRIDWIETDHAPHTLDEKTKPPYASGIPGLAWWPLFEEYLRRKDFSEQLIEDLTFNNAARRFGLQIERKRRKLVDRRKDYPFDPYKEIAEQFGWTA